MNTNMPFFGQTPRTDRRSGRLETAAFICGVVSIVTSCLVYTSFVCGALAITFALLSRGGEPTMTPKAKSGLILGCIGLFLITFLISYTIFIAEYRFGGVTNMLRQLYDSLGLDYDSILSSRG